MNSSKNSTLIPKEWETEKIKNLCSFINRGISPKYCAKSSYKIINQACIYWSQFKDSNLKFLSEEFWPKIRKELKVKKLDVLLNSTGTGTLGRALVFDKEKGDFIADGHITILRTINNILNPYYLAYYFETNIGQKYIYNYCVTGSTNQVELSKRLLENLKISIPPIKEQNKITSILSTVGNLIENTENLIKAYSLLKKGLIQTLLTKGIGHTKFKKTEIGEIPEEWEINNLNEIIKTIESGGRPTGGATETSGTIPSFGGENILKDGEIDYISVRKISLDYFNNMGKGKLKDKDILINKDGANTGKVSIYSNKYYREASINEHIFLIRVFNKTIIPEFLFYYLYSANGQYYLKLKITGSAQPGINKTFINNFPVPIPPVQEQKFICNILLNLDEQILILKNKKDTLELLKKGLMQQLLTGKIRVKV